VNTPVTKIIEGIAPHEIKVKRFLDLQRQEESLWKLDLLITLEPENPKNLYKWTFRPLKGKEQNGVLIKLTRSLDRREIWVDINTYYLLDYKSSRDLWKTWVLDDARTAANLNTYYYNTNSSSTGS
jgi:hypothetical protein